MEEYQEKYMHERVQKDVEGRKTFDRERDLTFRRIAPDKKKQMLEHGTFFPFYSLNFISFHKISKKKKKKKQAK